MTTTTATAPVTARALTLTYDSLRRLLEPVLPHVDRTPQAHPALSRVAIASAGHHLVAQATDGHTAGVSRQRLFAKPAPVWSTMLRHDDAEALLAWATPEVRRHGVDPAVVLTPLEDGGLQAHISGATLPGGVMGHRVTFGPPDGVDTAFPDLTSVLTPTVDPTVPVMRAADFHLEYLARFAPAERLAMRSAQLRMPVRPGLPLLVLIGDDFLGAVMPTMPKDAATVASPSLDTWRGAIPRGVRP